MRVGVVGIGAMGAPMAHAIIAAGHEVTVHGRSRERAAPLLESGARWSPTARELATASELVLSMLPDLPQLESLLDGADGLLAGVRAPLLLVVGSTSSADRVRALARVLDERTAGNAHVVDAPVSGGVEGAAAGDLAIMVGGAEADVSLALPVLRACGTPTRLGALGVGQVAKAANQVVVAATMLALAEASVIAEREGLDLAGLLDAFGRGYAGSRVLETKRAQLLSGEYTSAGRAAYMAKDLVFAAEAARATQTRTPLLDVLERSFAGLVDAGLGDVDLAVAKRYIEVGAPSPTSL